MSSPTAPPTVHRIPIIIGFLLCVFAVGTAELLVAGLLPQIADQLDVSLGAAGQAVTSYAVGVVIGGPLVTAATARLPRKGLTLALVAVFTLGCLLCAVATSYRALLAARLLSALAHSTLVAVALVVVVSVVPPARAGRAIAAVVSGLTFATLIGVPLAATIGQQFGWRVPFLAVGAIALLGGAVLAVTLPRTPAPETGLPAEFRALVQRPVLLAIATTSVGFAGVFTVLTYIVPLLTRVSGFTERAAAALLFVYGAGSLVGNLVSGRLSERSLSGTLRGALLGLAAVLALLSFATAYRPSSAAVILMFGLLATATITPLQILILRHAESAPTLAVAVNVSAFNLANAHGAVLGCTLVTEGALRWTGAAGAVLAMLGFGLSYLALPRRVR
jgi:DHA1 family inner membrane transport protein